jgi:hypothetical protein
VAAWHFVGHQVLEFVMAKNYARLIPVRPSPSWAMLRTWAAGLRDHELTPEEQRRGARTLCSILDSCYDLEGRHPQLSAQLWQAALALADKIALSKQASCHRSDPMGWPLSQDYNEAIQNPGHCFSDPDLRAGKAVTSALGIPLPCSGNFADVYQVSCPDGSRWAVKCFTREAPGLRDRYAVISDHLRAAQLPFTVDFRYLDQGIRIQGRWFPALKMEWVEGFTLNEFVRANLDKPATLEALLQLWVRMARRLREAKIAHGDLQQGNILLVPGGTAPSLAVKLIDYDGMWVPALAGTPSGEVGHPAYQHPQRLREETYSGEVDRFPLLVIYCAIRALVVGGRALWERYDNGDNLLFREQDLRRPRDSALFWELVRLHDPELRRLVDCLSRSVYKSLDDVPHLVGLVAQKRTSSPVNTPAGAPARKAARRDV